MANISRPKCSKLAKKGGGMKIIMLLLALPLGLQAGIKCVDDDNNTSTQNGSSQYPYISIQAAITNAVDNDTIKVAAGTYSRIDNQGKILTILGGYQGGTSSSYNAGTGGNFLTRTADPTLTIISGGADSIGVNLTRFNFDPFMLVFDNFTVKNSKKGIVCDRDVSWPHVSNVTISNNIIENNGQPGITTGGAGILVTGDNHKILNNIIRNNRGGRGAGISGSGGSPNFLLVEGNRVENNTGYDDHCAGIYLGGEVTIRNNIISGNRLENSYGWGGGLVILGTAHMSFNIIKDNFCPSYGGALFVDEGGIAYMDNELIYHNSTSGSGGEGGAGVGLDDGVPGSSYVYMTNCTVVNNYSPGVLGGNAVFFDVNSFCILKNCIMAGNGDDFYVTSGSSLTATYTLSQEGIVGKGNFIADPLFADSLNGDFHLKSRSGRYNPVSQSWVVDNIHSPAIDAGDSTSSYNNEPAPNGNRINLGSYGNTIYASKSFPGTNSVQALAEAEVPKSHHLYQNFPNPFNPSTTIRYSLPKTADVSLRIFNTLGQEVALLVNEQKATGYYQSTWNADVPSGIYFCRLQAGDFVETRKLVLLR
jgi:parallel beta-helix repeat protein